MLDKSDKLAHTKATPNTNIASTKSLTEPQCKEHKIPRLQKQIANTYYGINPRQSRRLLKTYHGFAQNKKSVPKLCRVRKLDSNIPQPPTKIVDIVHAHVAKQLTMVVISDFLPNPP
jgi:hypothetical protein